jgi:protease-4
MLCRYVCLRDALRWSALAVMILTVPAALAQKKVVRLLLQGEIIEAPSPSAELRVLLGEDPPQTLHKLLETIRKASEDDTVAGMVLILEGPRLGIAQVEDLTRALEKFRARGKKVYCYADHAGNAAYALASAADHVTLAEYSALEIQGLNAELIYLKGLLDKIGVHADMLHAGAYKSALEPFTRTEPSEEAAENVNWLLDGIYARWTELIAQGRKLPVEKVREAVDAAPIQAQDALDRKLVDAVSSFLDFKQMIQKEYGKDVELIKRYDKKDKPDLDMSNPFSLIQSFKDMFEAKRPGAKPGIGLIYVDGPIMPGKSDSSPFGGDGTVGSTTIRAALEEARNDANIKAVVLRVNSPGGSALGSDIMWEAATRLKKEKPLIVSMGGVAGSGGYYVAIPGDTIFAEETTITGSIGVVFGKLVLRGLLEDKLGITSTAFRRGSHAGLFSSMRTWTPEERAFVEHWMNDIYEQFKGRVRASRGDRLKGDLEQLAGGRVYTGRQALERGLVDQIGGLSDAIAFASQKAGLDKYEIYPLPKPDDFATFLAKLTGQDTPDEYEISLPRSGAGAFAWPAAALPGASGVADAALLQRRLAPLLGELPPAQLGALLRHLRNALLIQREHVGMFMPLELDLR